MTALEEYEEWRHRIGAPETVHLVPGNIADAAIESLKCCCLCAHAGTDGRTCKYGRETSEVYAGQRWTGTSRLVDPHGHCCFTPSRWKESK